MPNDCWNNILIYAPKDVIQEFLDAKEALADLLDDPTEAIVLYNWKLECAGEEAIQFCITSAWGPPLTLLEFIVRAKPIDFMKVSWYVEDGAAGIWTANKNTDSGYTIQKMTWDEGCLEEKAHRFRK